MFGVLVINVLVTIDDISTIPVAEDNISLVLEDSLAESMPIMWLLSEFSVFGETLWVKVDEME